MQRVPEAHHTCGASQVMKCTQCGKPCRTDAEKTLHARHTGHTEFVDAVRDHALFLHELKCYTLQSGGAIASSAVPLAMPRPV